MCIEIIFGNNAYKIDNESDTSKDFFIIIQDVYEN